MTEYDLDALIEREGMDGLVREYEKLHSVVNLSTTQDYLPLENKDFAGRYFEARKHNLVALLNLQSPFDNNHYLFPAETAKDKFKRKQHFFDTLQQANLQFNEALKYQSAQSWMNRRKALLHLTAFDYVEDLVAYAGLISLFSSPERKGADQEELVQKIITGYAGILQKAREDVGMSRLPLESLASMVNLSHFYPLAQENVRNLTASCTGLDSERSAYLLSVAEQLLKAKNQPALLAWESGKDFVGAKLEKVGAGFVLAGGGLLTYAVIPGAAGIAWIAYIATTLKGKPAFDLSYLQGGALLAGSYVSIKMGKSWVSYIDDVMNKIHSSCMTKHQPLIERIIKERELRVLE